MRLPRKISTTRLICASRIVSSLFLDAQLRDAKIDTYLDRTTKFWKPTKDSGRHANEYQTSHFISPCYNPLSRQVEPVRFRWGHYRRHGRVTPERNPLVLVLHLAPHTMCSSSHTWWFCCCFKLRVAISPSRRLCMVMGGRVLTSGATLCWYSSGWG
jgi:hypothetical protein